MRAVKGAIGLCLLLVLGGAVWFGSFVLTPAPSTTETVITIPRGSGVRQIHAILADQGLVSKDVRFLILARLSGTARHLRSGEYGIPPGLKPLQILRLLEKGNVIRHPVTIPEGLTIRQIAAILAKDGWADPERFLKLAGDRGFIAQLGFDHDSLEGYLFPDTYLLARGEVTEESLLKMMTGRFLTVWGELTGMAGPVLPRHHVVTLASIVEKETADAAERPLIARVFLNRLDRNMRLQSDPTVIYGLADFSGDLTRQDLNRESPYNTYLIAGLPPGPICNPGRASIDAVLHPADAPYLFFVSKNNGSHSFSVTLREHNKAVRQYQTRRPPVKEGEE